MPYAYQNQVQPHTHTIRRTSTTILCNSSNQVIYREMEERALPVTTPTGQKWKPLARTAAKTHCKGSIKGMIAITPCFTSPIISMSRGFRYIWRERFAPGASHFFCVPSGRYVSMISYVLRTNENRVLLYYCCCCIGITTSLTF